jgi:hypothetical protein
MEKARRFTVSLPLLLHKRFKLRCVSDDKQMANFLCELLERELDRQDHKAAKPVRSEVRAA